MTIESLVHSNPTSPNHPNGGGGGRKLRKPSIDVYFPRGQGGGGASPLVSTSTLRGPTSGAGAGGARVGFRFEGIIRGIGRLMMLGGWMSQRGCLQRSGEFRSC
jgi:hypothetical protein